MADDRELIKKITKQFNSEARISGMVSSYTGAKDSKETASDPFELVRENFILSLIVELLPKNGAVLDIGCGLGHLLIRLLQQKIHCFGFDLSQSLIEMARQSLTAAGHDPSCVELANLFEYKTKKKVHLAVANGVIWYYDDKRPFLEQVLSFLEVGGISIIVHRNDLFNLFAFNSGTLDFLERHFTSDLAGTPAQAWRAALEAELPGMKAAVQKHVSSALKKDYENPLEIHNLYQQSGFRIREIAYTYIHPLPPRLSLQLPANIYETVQAHYGRNWQGMFLGSQFVVIAEKLG